MRNPGRRRTLHFLKRSGATGCIVILTMWATSVVYAISYDSGRVGFLLYAGMIGGTYVEGTPDECHRFNDVRQLGWEIWSLRPEFDQASEFGFRLPKKSSPLTYAKYAVAIHQFELPLWIPFCVFLLIGLPGILLEQQFREGSCPNCGYDLRGTPDRCPECGLVIEQSPLNRMGRKRRKPLRTLFTAFTLFWIMLFVTDEFDLFVTHRPRAAATMPDWLPMAGALIIANLLWYWIGWRSSAGKE